MYRAVFPLLLVLSGGCGIVMAQMPGQKMPGPPPMEATQTSAGFRATAGKEVLDVTVCADSVIHVVARPDGAAGPESPRPWMLDKEQSCAGAPFTAVQDARSFRVAGLSETIPQRLKTLIAA